MLTQQWQPQRIGCSDRQRHWRRRRRQQHQQRCHQCWRLCYSAHSTTLHCSRVDCAGDELQSSSSSAACSSLICTQVCVPFLKFLYETTKYFEVYFYVSRNCIHHVPLQL